MLAVWDLKNNPDYYKKPDIHDCMIAEHLLSLGENISDEDKILKKYKVTNLTELADLQIKKFEKLPKLYKLFIEIEIPLARVLGKMEQTGIVLDTDKLRNLGGELGTEIAGLENEIKKIVMADINLNSSTQVGNYLAESQGVPLAKTKTGRYATGESELAKFSGQFPIINKILKYRELSKLSSTYVESLIEKADKTGRIHTSYNQVAVSTGRLSSSNPNLQNIPVGSDYGVKIKDCFRAEDGYVLVSFDYSQQELRILAHLSGEGELIKAFENNQDVHKTTASKLFKVKYEDVTSSERSIAKTINFGIIYGMGGFGMSQTLEMSPGEAQEFIDKFYASYPKIKKYYDEYLSRSRVDGYAETLFGKRRSVFEFPGQKFVSNNMRRVLMNFPIQGTAAELMKLAMVKLDREVLQKDDSIKLLLQIHDDLVFEIEDNKDLKKKIKSIHEIMCNVCKLSVPIEVDIKTGKSWGKMEKLEF